MKISTKRVWLSFLFIVLLEEWFCEGCWKEERDALLHLKAQAKRSEISFNSDWVDGTDCCLWERVECNKTTRRVAKLHLEGMLHPLDESGCYLNMSDFQVFDALESLYLTDNGIVGCVENKGAGSGNITFSLRNLKHLHLGFNRFNDSSIIPCFSSIGGDKTLLFPSDLEDLDLRSNLFSIDIISSLRNLERLKQLDLSINRFSGSVDISELNALIKLEMLDLGGNGIESFVVRQGIKISFTNLKTLRLSGCSMDVSMLRKSLQPFQYIKKLDLASSQFMGTILARDFAELDNLEDLKLDWSYHITNEFFRSIGSLSSLKVLSIRSCYINGTLPIRAWFNLKKLEKLDISNNQFEGPLPISFANMTSLRSLDISKISFVGNPAPLFASLTSLECIDFTDNQLDIPASFTFLANYSNLQFFQGDGNKIIADPYPIFQTWVPKFQLQVFRIPSTTNSSFLPLPNFLFHQYNLIEVDLSSIKYGGEFPKWLMENNTNMKVLILRNCTFTGHFQLPSHPLPYIQHVDIFNNALTGQIPGKNISSIFPCMKYMGLSRNAFHGSLPHEFGQMSSLETLDLSYNKLDGPVCPTLSTLNTLKDLHLNDNNFSGSVESCFNITSLESLDVSDNHFVGKLLSAVPQICPHGLWTLLMANNKLEGSIPREFFKLQSFLEYLDLSENNLSGSLPSLPSSLMFAHLSNNKLSDLPATVFNESLSLELLDLSNNEITSQLQDMSNISRLNALILKGNHFIGQIPNNLCKLQELSILDFSYNKLSGSIPNCLGEIPFSSFLYMNNEDYSFYFQEYKEHEHVNFTTKKRSETYKGNILVYMSGLDLSHNELNGNIPLELGNMTFIRAINLSHSHLTGQIPMAFSYLKQIESLDLSFNQLTGEIPLQLTELTSLEVFSLANNNLSGRTPERKNQFLTFDEGTYEGNPFLCGAPLDKICFDANGQTPGILPNEELEDDDFMDKRIFYISFVVSYTSMLLAVIIVLYINPHWRQSWFHFTESVIINSYYFVVDNFHRWFTNGNM